MNKKRGISIISFISLILVIILIIGIVINNSNNKDNKSDVESIKIENNEKDDYILKVEEMKRKSDIDTFESALSIFKADLMVNVGVSYDKKLIKLLEDGRLYYDGNNNNRLDTQEFTGRLSYSEEMEYNIKIIDGELVVD